MLSHRARARILRYLERRGLITFAAEPGDGEVNAVLGEEVKCPDSGQA